MTGRSFPPIALTLGDPAGCGPVISHAAWQALRTEPDLAFCLIGPEDVAAEHGPVQSVSTLAEACGVFPDALPVFATAPAEIQPVPGTPDPRLAPTIIASIEQAAALAQAGEATAIVTNPINKAVLYEAGFEHPGHTEFLASLCACPNGNAPRPVMMLVGGGLRVALATIHQPLVKAAGSLSTDALIEIGRITHAALRSDFGLASPRLAFTGLNPHAGENGALGREEIDIINPAAEALRSSGVNMSDARSADTVFAETLGGAYDAVIAMTHDQGLIPIKTLDFWGGVNVTLGLPIIRTSPDHGTAYEAAAAGNCRPDSLIAAIRLAADLARNRAQVRHG